MTCVAVRWSGGALAGFLALGGPGKPAGEILDLSLGWPRPGQALLPSKGGFTKVVVYSLVYLGLLDPLFDLTKSCFSSLALLWMLV